MYYVYIYIYTHMRGLRCQAPLGVVPTLCVLQLFYPAKGNLGILGVFWHSLLAGMAWLPATWPSTIVEFAVFWHHWLGTLHLCSLTCLSSLLSVPIFLHMISPYLIDLPVYLALSILYLILCCLISAYTTIYYIHIIIIIYISIFYHNISAFRAVSHHMVSFHSWMGVRWTLPSHTRGGYVK